MVSVTGKARRLRSGFAGKLRLQLDFKQLRPQFSGQEKIPVISFDETSKKFTVVTTDKVLTDIFMLQEVKTTFEGPPNSRNHMEPGFQMT